MRSLERFTPDLLVNLELISPPDEAPAQTFPKRLRSRLSSLEESSPSEDEKEAIKDVQFKTLWQLAARLGHPHMGVSVTPISGKVFAQMSTLLSLAYFL